MAADVTNLRTPQALALQVLAEGGSIEAAAAVAGASARTVRRWRSGGLFARALREQRDTALRGVVAKLVSGAATGADFLAVVVADAEMPPTTRVAAARALVDLAFRGVELLDLDDRVTELERIMVAGASRRREAA